MERLGDESIQLEVRVVLAQVLHDIARLGQLEKDRRLLDAIRFADTSPQMRYRSAAQVQKPSNTTMTLRRAGGGLLRATCAGGPRPSRGDCGSAGRLSPARRDP